MRYLVANMCDYLISYIKEVFLMTNCLQPLFDLVRDSGKILLKWLFDGWLDPYQIDLDYFFKACNIKNSLGEYPKVVKKNKTVFISTIPVGLNLDTFKRYQEAMEIYVNNKVKLEVSSGWLRVEIITKQLPEVIEYKSQKRASSYIKFDIGESFGGVVTLNLKENPHTYIVGVTGSGKSIMTKVILTSLIDLYKPSELELYLADLKMVELNLFRNVKHCKKFVYTVEDTNELIADLLEETKKRYDLFMKSEVTSIFEYNKLPGIKKLKYQVLFIEEIVMLLEDKNKSAMKLLKQLIAISRASGCYVFLTTQRPSNDIVDNVVKANINNRIVLKCEDKKNSIVALDEDGAEKLRGNGHGYLKNGSNIQEFQGYFITDEQTKECINKHKKKEPNKPVNNNESLCDMSFLDKL